MIRRYFRITIIVIATLGFMGYSDAEEAGLNKQLSNSESTQEYQDGELQRLVVPKLHVSLKSTPKFTYIPSVTSIFPFKTDTDPTGPTSDSNPYTLLFNLEDIRKERIETLYETHGFNKIVERHLYFYSKKFKKGFLKRLKRAGRYLETMAKIFREKKLPQELVFLPLIESGFKLNAYSPKRAAGPWQFIPATAKSYGLRINWWVDERRDPIKSTKAAAEYLSNLYEIFGSWNLALAAYNAGEGKILRAVKRAKTNDFWMLRKTRHIKRETKNYVPSYIAATAITLDPEGFGFENVAYHNPFEYEEVVIDSPMDLEAVAEFSGTDVAEIKELNPELRRWCTPPNVSSYTLRIPAGTKEMFLSNLSNAKGEDLFYVEFYTVKSGDTVGKIGRRFGVPTRAIIDVNSLNRRALIISGSKILIPSKRDADIRKEGKSSNRIRPILKSRPRKKLHSKTSI